MSTDVRDHSRQFAMVPHDVIDAVQDAKALALYLVLKKYAHQHTKLAHPSRGRLAKHLGYKTTRPVDEALDVLKQVGLVRTFPRFRDEEGNIGYRQDDRYRERTSNGYELYDTPYAQQDTPLWPTGHNPHSPQAITPMAHRPQELDPCELNPGELDSSAHAEKKKESVAVSLPEGWEPRPDVIEQMRQECPSIDLEYEHRKFSDYWAGIGGARGRKKDWNTTWRNWIRNANERRGNQPRGFGNSNGQAPAGHRPLNAADRKNLTTMLMIEDSPEVRRILETGYIPLGWSGPEPDSPQQTSLIDDGPQWAIGA